jgi:hypothetical protein
MSALNFSKFSRIGFILELILCSCFINLPAPSQVRIAPTVSVHGCDFCLASQGISPLEAGASGLRVDLRYVSLGTVYQDGKRTDNREGELESHLTQQYSLLYSPSHLISVGAIVPVARRHFERAAGNGTVAHGTQYGLGDISLLVRVKPIVEHDLESTLLLSILAGVKFPTGKTDGRDNLGELLDAHIQLGTGSTDLLLGASAFAGVDRFAFIVNLLGGFAGKGANGHMFGNALNYEATVRYRVWPDDYEFPEWLAVLGFSGDLRGHEKTDNLDDPDSGGHVAYLSPGLQVMVSTSITLDLVYQQPLLHRLYGRQLGEDFRVMVGLQFLL